jgi:hypothetical protein
MQANWLQFNSPLSSKTRLIDRQQDGRIPHDSAVHTPAFWASSWQPPTPGLTDLKTSLSRLAEWSTTLTLYPPSLFLCL